MWESVPTWVKGLVGGAVAMVMNLDPVIKAMFILMALDILSGLLRSVFDRTISSEVSLKGMVKKSFMLILVGVAAVIQRYLVTGSLPVDLVIGTAGFFCVTEIISILENAAACKQVIPPVLENFIKGDLSKGIQSRRK